MTLFFFFVFAFSLEIYQKRYNIDTLEDMFYQYIEKICWLYTDHVFNCLLGVENPDEHIFLCLVI